MKSYAGIIATDVHNVHVLIEVHESGTATIATRPSPWATWGPPVDLESADAPAPSGWGESA